MPLAKITPFADLYGFLQSEITTATSSFGNGLLAYVIAPLGLAATVYFLLLGYGVLRGAIQTPVRELTWQIGKVGMVFAACTATFYSSVVVSGVPQIATSIISAGGGTAIANPGELFDKYVGNVTNLVGAIENGIKQSEGSASGWSIGTALLISVDALVGVACIILNYAMALLSALFGFCIELFALLGVQICVALAPLAFASLLFNSSRFFFDGWMRQTLNYSLLMVIMSIVTNLINSMVTQQMTYLLGQAAPASTAAGSPVNSFVVAQGTTFVCDVAAILLATCYAVVIYTVGTIFFFETPRIASGIVGGAASSGHGFLQSASNGAMNRMLSRRRAGGPAGAGSGGSVRSGGGAGGSASSDD